MTAIGVVECRGETYALLPGRCWHLTHSNSNLLHNARLGGGKVQSVSVWNRSPEMEGGVCSPYSLKAMSDPKEQIWERVRLGMKRGLPSRQGAIYLFDNEKYAHEAMHSWFPGQTRTLVEARIALGSRVHAADARLLECVESDWEACAERYWQGEMKAAPIREILVDGTVYFPGWREEPFGLMKPMQLT